ncbi:polysaccharide deacetylase family protein [Rhodococcus sp. NPDC059968]|uniref:polysaccharide deacetylase family protein n=1 Tax=Rhodococcus sp. NPDC059968 TaxID=3347017 RepID=UPI0036701D65
MTGHICVTVDNLGRAREVGLGEVYRPDRTEPGLEVGVPRMLGLFDELAIRTTFFVEGWNALHHRDVLDSILAEDHEIGLHGWVHENWAELPEGQQERLLFDGTAAIRMAGITPSGFRAPGGYRGSRTAALLAELGYAYDSSVEPATEDDPLVVSLLPEGLVNIPWHWQSNDYWQYYMHPAGPQSPDQVLASWRADLERVAHDDSLLTITVHPFVSGADADKFSVLRAFLTEAACHPDLEVITTGQLVARARTAITAGPSPL